MSFKSTFTALGTIAAPSKAVPEKKAAAVVISPVEVLLAWRAPGINPHLLVAYKPGTDPTNPTNLVTVRVKSNHNFLPHMKLRVRLDTGTFYDLVGPLPRWRGRY